MAQGRRQIVQRVLARQWGQAQLQRLLVVVFADVVTRDRPAPVSGAAGEHELRGAQSYQTRQNLVDRILVTGGGDLVQGVDDEHLAVAEVGSAPQ